MEFSNNELLKDIIISHYDAPNNRLAENTDLSTFITYQNKSSSCIDDITVHIEIKEDVINNIYFSGVGCAISTASTDIFCDLLKNKRIHNAKLIIEEYKKMIYDKEYNKDILDELIAFKNIKNQPNRINCSIIGVNAIISCLNIESKE